MLYLNNTNKTCQSSSHVDIQPFFIALCEALHVPFPQQKHIKGKEILDSYTIGGLYIFLPVKTNISF